MKKTIILFLLFASQINFGQNIFPNDGNVGIGISNPNSKLEVIGDDSNVLEVAGFYNARVYGNANDKSEARINIGKLEIGTIRQPMGAVGAFPVSNTDSSNGILAFYTRENQSVIERMRVNSNGNVGIGTTNPDAKLVVNGDAKVKENLFISGTSGGYTTGDNPILYFGIKSDFSKISVPFADKMIFSSYHGYTFNTSYNGSTALPSLTIGVTGNVGIGETNPNNKLDVKGTVHSQEVKVDMLGWSDFVFKKEYTLPTLEEVEKQIAENGHLANIPSEEEVLKNGINLGEMNSKLLQKIEELTLYVIEQNKKISNLEETNKKLTDLERRFNQLEKTVK